MGVQKVEKNAPDLTLSGARLLMYFKAFGKLMLWK
jgi:hypothetical protein